MAGSTQTTRFRFWRWLIRFIGVIVPRRFRARFRQEWEAELGYREALLARWDRLDWRNKLKLLWRSLGAFWDALWLQRQRWEDEMIQDLRFGVRMLLKNPGFTFVAALTLALGIGANTAIFSLIDAVLLKLLPVRNPNELVIVAHAGKNAPSRSANYPFYEFLRDHNQSFAGLFAFWPIDFKVRPQFAVEPVTGQYVTANYFAALGVQAMLGRAISATDTADSAVAVISHRFWEQKLGKDPAVIGKTLVVNGQTLTIIGVTPPGFLGLLPGEPAEVSLPLALQPRVTPDYGNRLTMREGWWSLTILGRLKPEQPVEQARAEIDLLLRQWLTENKFPEEMIKGNFARAELLPGNQGIDVLRRRFSSPLLVLAASVGLVLLLACANITNLLLGKATGRRKEMAVRLAVGASRWRLIRQLLTEGMLLATLGGVAGVLFGWWGSSLLLWFISSGPVPVVLEVGPDLRALAFTAAVSLLTGLLVGLVPAWQSTRIDLTPALKESGAPAVFGGRWQAGRALVAVQVALSLTLMIGALLFVFSLRNITAIDAGFRVENLLLASFSPDGTGYKRERLTAFYIAALERVKSLPGVSAASLSSNMPLSIESNTRPLNVPGFTARSPEDHKVHLNCVSAAFFETMRTPVLSGREFTPRDDAKAARVAVVNETLARFYFGDRDPIGKVVRIGREPDAAPIEIVGVVQDSKREDLREPTPRMIYLPFLQYPYSNPTLEIRTAANGATLIPTVRQALSEVNRDIPIREIKTAQAQLESGLVQERLLATLASCFGALALLLAALGLYGALAHFVTRKTNEIGIRLALGAQRRDVLRLVMSEAAWPVSSGVAIGLLAAWAVRSVAPKLLFGLTATNPVVLLLSVVVLLATAGLAAYLPARRATKVDPMIALRSE